MRLATAAVIVALSLCAPVAENPDPVVATVRTAEVTAELEHGTMRVKLSASGTPPDQQIDTLRIWIDDSELAVPRDAYSGSWNPNPAAIEIRQQAGLKMHLLPEDVVLPIIAVTIVGYDGESAFTLFLEQGVVAFSYVRVVENLECRPFNPRYAATCETVRKDVEKSREGRQ